VATGCLIVIALGAVAGQLQRLNEALTHAPMPGHEHAPFEPMTADAAADAAALPPPFEPPPFEPREPAASQAFPMPPEPAPSLRNPDETVEVEEEVSLSPPQLAAELPAEEKPRDLPSWMRARPQPEPAKEQRSSIFDSMWPPENKMFGRGDTDTATAPAEPEPAPAEPTAEEERPAPVEAAPFEPAPPVEEAAKPRAVAILKSGVVDGMSYTLYVDGSIEAELPQGTLRFASIHELRAHLEQNG
jgi:hypothetical protein